MRGVSTRCYLPSWPWYPASASWSVGLPGESCDGKSDIHCPEGNRGLGVISKRIEILGLVAVFGMTVHSPSILARAETI